MMRMVFRRRRDRRTNYRRRLRLLLGRKNRIVVRKSLSGFTIQLVKYRESGDETLVEVSSGHLKKYGWKLHRGNLSSAYLTGYLFGKVCAKKGFIDGIIDLGLQSKTSQALFAVALGIKDVGIDVKVGAEIPEDRLKGQHISKYAEYLKKNDNERYRKQFSAYLKDGVSPENVTQHFEETKKKIEET